MKQQSLQDKAHYRKFKKRNRKDLSYDEIEQLLAAAREPYRLHKDIATQFKVSANLVGQLVKESRVKPEKIHRIQAEEILVARKKQVIEDAATALLAANKQFVCIQ